MPFLANSLQRANFWQFSWQGAVSVYDNEDHLQWDMISHRASTETAFCC